MGMGSRWSRAPFYRGQGTSACGLWRGGTSHGRVRCAPELGSAGKADLTGGSRLAASAGDGKREACRARETRLEKKIGPAERNWAARKERKKRKREIKGKEVGPGQKKEKRKKREGDWAGL